MIYPYCYLYAIYSPYVDAASPEALERPLQRAVRGLRRRQPLPSGGRAGALEPSWAGDMKDMGMS